MQNPEGFECPQNKEARPADHLKFLKSRDVARILDISPDDVVALVHRGELRAMKVGRLWRYRVADVQAYSRRHPARSDAVG